MRRTILLISLCLITIASEAQDVRPDTLWYRYDNRFTANKAWDISEYDTIEFRTSSMYLYKPDGGKKYLSSLSSTPGVFMFTDPGRILYKPSSMSGDFTSATNQWCFDRSKESEHFVCFWENGSTADVDYILQVAEKSWDVYTDQLGFLEVGNSSTDTYKILIRAYNISDWIASGSGEDMKIGTLNISPSAATARGGHTVAHEIGHTFQYLTNVDCGANDVHGFNYGLGENGAGGNGFWEDCANWMAYKVYPERQFTDGEYFEGYLTLCHLNLMHETARYYNCFYQDYLCDKFGQNFIGRLWREAINPEDPVDAIMRLEDLSQDEFSALMYDCFAHMCTWDIESVRSQASHRVGAYYNRLSSRDVDGEEWFQVDSAYCPQNYGYNITRLKLPEAGTTVTVRFQGIAGAEGYRSINKSKAGWRWGLVAYNTDGSTTYGDMQSSSEGTASFTVGEDCQELWLVVMGAPTTWWHHEWDDDVSDDEQWPYRVQIEGSRPYGCFRTYTADDFPDDYVRKDTTVVIDAELAYSSSSYSSTWVQYDMDAISEALGIPTADLLSIKVGSGNPYFAGVSNSGALTTYVTTTTSSSTCYGHWFTTAGNVSGYDSSAAVFAEMYPASYQCNVGQYPGRLSAGKTYTTRQAVVYKAPDGNTYKATMEIHLTVY
ncbi:MAG: DUF4859 domain-containing protein [Prevotellaceae bacterium]|nr:DUF4859 domain-containing protein [Prevotellaceae bacterium]